MLALLSIITLAPVLSEWTAEILGEKNPRAQIVAVSEYSHYPEALKLLPTIGAYPQLKIEAIAAKKPDLLIGSEEYNRADQLQKLRQLKLKLEVLPREEFKTMPAWIRKLAAALGEVKNGEAAVKKWEDALKEIPVSKVKKRVFIQVQQTPLVTVGGQSFLNEAFDRAGYENIFKNLNQAYPKVSKEAVLKENPEFIFILDLTGFDEDFKKEEAEWRRYPTLKAVKDKHLRRISGDDFARCSLRLLKALKELH